MRLSSITDLRPTQLNTSGLICRFASVARTTQTCPRDIFDQRNSVILPAAVINECTTLYAHIFRKAGNRSANVRSRRIERYVLPGVSRTYTRCTKTYRTKIFC